MTKPKYSAEFKCMVAKVYLNGEGNYQGIARKYDVGIASVEFGFDVTRIMEKMDLFGNSAIQHILLIFN